MSDTNCKGDHNGHLCVLASQGCMDKIQTLVKGAEFICFNCGRTAREKENLCNPMPLK